MEISKMEKEELGNFFAACEKNLSNLFPRFSVPFSRPPCSPLR
jgi:hypothetical protein